MHKFFSNICKFYFRLIFHFFNFFFFIVLVNDNDSDATCSKHSMTELCIWFCPALSKGVKYTPISQACSQSVHVWLSIWFLFFASCVSQVQVDENKVEVVRLRPVFTIATKRMPVTEGVVEVKNKDGWAQICDNGWTPKNSHVVCGMMGFPHEKKVNKNFYK